MMADERNGVASSLMLPLLAFHYKMRAAVPLLLRSPQSGILNSPDARDSVVMPIAVSVTELVHSFEISSSFATKSSDDRLSALTSTNDICYGHSQFINRKIRMEHRVF